MSRLILLGLSHATAPLDIRERVAFSPGQLPAALLALRGQFAGTEAVILSTCNRTELYVARSAAHGPPEPDDLVNFLSQFHAADPELIRAHTYRKTGRDAAEHLFHVAASLDSMVLGETQILGQVRDAYDLARTTGATGPELNTLFQRAVAAGRRVIAETSLTEGRLSVASVAVDLASRIFDTLADKTVLAIGAGKMAALVLQHFAALTPRRLLVTNRDPAKAATLAARFNAQPVPMPALTDHLTVADVVITSTGSRLPIITRAALDGLMRRRRYRPLFLIDIALPRDIEPTVGDIEHVYLYNIDDLQQVIARTEASRRGAVDAARELVARQLADYDAATRARALGPVIDQLTRRCQSLAEDELRRTLGKFPDITPAEREHLEDLTRRIVNKLLHDPLKALREGDTAHPSAYAHMVRKMFALPEPPSAPTPPPSEDA